MDCGTPFCQSGCPLGNIIPEFNDAVFKGDWELAFRLLYDTNNFPEFTGRICPAPCEQACVLGINRPPVAIEHIEKTIAEIAFEKGYMRPHPPATRTGKHVAVIGSGPAGLAAAVQLNKAGHSVVVFEKDDRLGGLLRYGIPDFKLEKWVVERRIAMMEAEGIRFKTNAYVGENVDAEELLDTYDALLLCGGSIVPRDLEIPGRNLKGIHFAMEFLVQNNRRVAGELIDLNEEILAENKNVLVIGAGDTGSDCIGTSIRQNAKSILQIEVLPKPSEERDMDTWPQWPDMLRSSSSHDEGCEREWSVLTKAFLDDGDGHINNAEVVDIEWSKDPDTGKFVFSEIKKSQRIIPCDLALLSIGFVHPRHEGLLQKLEIDLDHQGNVYTARYQTNIDNVFCAGDMRRGQSLVVWAIHEGREAAGEVDAYLLQKPKTLLEKRDVGLYNM